MAEAENDIVLVTVTTFPEPIEANIYRSRLESEGIPCVLGDENIISNQPFHSIAYGGVKLRVRQEDKEAALIFINEMRGVPDTEPETCPACNSINIKNKNSVVRRVLNIVWLILATAPANSNKRQCLNCGHIWRA